MTANAPIDLKRELESLKKNTDADILDWARSIAERVEESAYKNVENHTGFNLKAIPRLYPPSTEGKEI